MENVEIKKEEVKEEVKKVVKKEKKDSVKVAFMKDRNEKRKVSGLAPAYSEEEIKAHK